MNNHFATRNLHSDGSWKGWNIKNSAADNSPHRLSNDSCAGLGNGFKKYRELSAQIGENGFSNNGNEICFATMWCIPTSEAYFGKWWTRAGITGPSDHFGLGWRIRHFRSKEYQTTKGSISQVLKGFQRTGNSNGYDIYVVKGWNYPQLVATYKLAADKTRKTYSGHHTWKSWRAAAGHSTSGSHERYKSPERLQGKRTRLQPTV